MRFGIHTISLQTQLTSLFSLLIGGISLFILFYVPSMIEKQTYAEMLSKFQTLALQTSLTIGPELIFDDREELENDISGLKINPAVRYLVVASDSGKIFASHLLMTANEADYHHTEGINRLASGEELFSISAPIYYSDKVIGHLYLGFSLSQLNEQIQATRITIAYICGIIFIVGVLIVIGISTIVTRPLQNMVQISEDIARGNLKKRAHEPPQREIGQLARAFNIMVDSLTTAQKDLLELNQTLEQRVYERTEKLYQEIATREQAEQQLRVSDEILKRVSSLIFVFDRKGKAIYVSPSVTPLLGYKPESLMGKGCWSLLHANQEKPNSGTHPLTDNGQGELPLQEYTYERSLQASDNSVHWILWHDSKGPGDLIISVGHDITERKHAEQALLESEKRYRHLFDFNPIPGWVYDTGTLVFLAVNESALQQYGYSREEFLTMTLRDIRHPEDIPALLESTTLAVEPVFQSSGPWRHRKKNGTIINVEIYSHALLYMGRQCRLVLAKDITEQIRYETQLRNLSRRLETIREDERVWIAREIHDQLGQSLTGLKMYINGMLKSVSKLTDENLSIALQERLQASSQLIDQTIGSIQAISTHLRPDILDKFGLVAALEWQSQEFQSRSEIRCELTTDLDDAKLDQQYTIALFRIVQEALTNVGRHAHAQRVAILLICEDNEILLEIKDNGCGISEADSSRPDSYGLIGIRERVSSLQGSFSIVGEPEKGTTISIRLPFLL